MRFVSQENVDVDLVTTNASNKSSSNNTELLKWKLQDSYRIQYFPCWNHNDLIVSPSLIQWISRHVKKYDIVHTNTIFSPLISIIHYICRQQNIPYLVTPRGMLDDWALAYKALKKRVYYSCIENHSLAWAKQIQVLTSPEKDQVNSLGFQETVLVPNGINPQVFSDLPDAEIFYQKYPHLRGKILILFLGRIDPKKGLNLLAPAFARAYKSFPNAHLIVAGPDTINFSSKVRGYFNDAQCLDSVTFTGMLTGKLKYAALAAANLYIAPSYSEGFSMSILEGMAAGLPCIITEGCNFPEAKTANAAYVVKTDTNDIGDALVQCLQNYKQAQLMGNTAKKFIFQNYTWHNSSKRLLRAYETILEKSQV